MKYPAWMLLVSFVNPRLCCASRMRSITSCAIKHSAVDAARGDPAHTTIRRHSSGRSYVERPISCAGPLSVEMHSSDSSAPSRAAADAS